MMRKKELRGFLWALVLLVWFLTNPVTALGGGVIIRGLELAVILTFLVGRRVPLTKQDILALLILVGLCVASVLFDKHNDYSFELLLRTAYYFVFCYIYASVTVYVLRVDETAKAFLKGLGWLSFGFIVFWFMHVSNTLQWVPGASFIGSEYGEFYQGFSRAITLLFLMVWCTQKEIVFPLRVLAIPLVFFIVIGFQSMGAVVALAVGLLLFAYSNSSSGNRKVTLAGFSRWAFLGLTIFIFSFFVIDNASDLPALEGFSKRLSEKLTADVVADEGRPWHIHKAVELTFSSLPNVLWGAGPINYACHVGYCESYRHPHNYFLLLWVWFGILGVLLSFLAVALLLRYSYISRGLRSPSFSLFVALTGYFFALAFFGGDIEQNRRLVFVLWLCVIYFRLLKPGGAKRKVDANLSSDYRVV